MAEYDVLRSKSQNSCRDYEGGYSRRSDKGWNKDRYRRRHSRDRDHVERRERLRDRDDSPDDYNRQRDKRRRRARSPSKCRAQHRMSSSRSTSKSKRISRYDMAPSTGGTSAMRAMDSAGLFTGITQPLGDMFPTMSLGTTGQQFRTLPVMPAQAIVQQTTRHARWVYAGGLPPTATEQSVATFFSQVLAEIGGNTAGPGDAVVNVYINREKKFAFVELRSVEEASNTMELDGITFEGAPMKVRRASDYNPSPAAAVGPSQPSSHLNLGAVELTAGSAGGLDGPDGLFVGGFPYDFSELQIRELLESFGDLREFNLVKDLETANSKGYVFCVYYDLTVSDIACAALNGIKMGEKTLTVRRANNGTIQCRPDRDDALYQAQKLIADLIKFSEATNLPVRPKPTKVLCLTQIVNVEELKVDKEYEDILEAVRSEGERYGTVISVVIPRPSPDGEVVAGLGKVFLEYSDTVGVVKAKLAMNGIKFDGKVVRPVFYPEDKFVEGNYDG